MPRNLLMPILAAMLAAAGPVRAAGAEDGTAAPPVYRVDPEGFGARAADIRAVCDSAVRTFWPHFPDAQLEPFVVVHGEGNPITLHRRNERGEVVMRLATGGTYWCQYAYQFAHEFCHILCGFDDDAQANQWFEETLAETASLYALRAMAVAWADEPPYPHWRDYRDALRSYADDVIRKREGYAEIAATGLAGFYRAHGRELAEAPCDRALNGAMAVALLPFFEQEPARWEAIRWLNSSPSPAGESFAQYLAKWHRAAPDSHRAFIGQLAGLYGIVLAEPAP